MGLKLCHAPYRRSCEWFGRVSPALKYQHYLLCINIKLKCCRAYRLCTCGIGVSFKMLGITEPRWHLYPVGVAATVVAVNDKTTKDMDFEAVRALAMTGTLGTVSNFE